VACPTEFKQHKILKNPQQFRIKGLLNASIDLASVIDEVPMGVAILDNHRRIVLLNQSLEALTGFSRHEARGIPCHHILRSTICIKDCPAQRMNGESESICIESDLVNRDRMRVPVRVNIAAIKGGDEKLVGFLEAVEDLRPIRELNAKIGRAYSFSHLVGRSPQMEKIFQIVPVLAQSDSSILITGETGTGKDMVAEAIHQASVRVKGPFVKVNCGALPETLLESELFGHQKGAFTGAVENKPGRFRLAHNGTMYLTEIGDLPLALQVKLLTFFDDQVVYPLGSTKGFQANVRVIAATHRNLERMVREGRFRQDLLFRLNVVRVQLPPLREREGDVRLLLDHFLNLLAARLGKKIGGITPKTLDVLTNYDYPGNVRELRNIIEYAVNVCQQTEIDRSHLPAYLTDVQEIAADSGVRTETPASPPHPTRDARVLPNEARTWASLERKMIMDALIKTGGHRGRAAAHLGWGRSTLWRKMKRYGIDRQ
jgi:PAS domain S-box-containing protein